MKTLTTKFIVLTLALFSMSVNAMTITSGQYELVGSVLIDTSSPRPDTIGIGEVSIIKNNGITVWQSGDSGFYVNYYFDGFLTTATAPNPISPSETLFTASSGRVNFYLSTVNDFDSTASYASQVALFETRTLALSTVSSGLTTGKFSTSKYSATGFLDVVGGPAAPYVDTNGLLNFASEATDMTFNISGDNVHPSGTSAEYDYSGSADLNGIVSPVPLPNMVWMFLLSVGSFLWTSKRSLV